MNELLERLGKTAVCTAIAASLLLLSQVALAQAKPALVRDVDSPGRNPYAAQLNLFTGTASCYSEGGGFQGCDFGGFPAVPAGMRLVMTDFSGQATAPAGCKINSILLRGSNFVNTTAVPHQSLAIPEVTLFHETILNFVDAGQSPIVTIDASCSGMTIGSQLLTVTGYLITLP